MAYKKKASSLAVEKFRADIDQRSLEIAKQGKVERTVSIDLSEKEKKQLNKEWEDEQKVKLRKEVENEMIRAEEYNIMVQEKLMKNTIQNLGVDYASFIAKEIKLVALLDATVKSNGNPDYTYVTGITNVTRRRLSRIWEQRGKILSQSPEFVRNRQKSLALESITIMEKLMESFSKDDLENMKIQDKIKLYDSLSKKTEMLTIDESGISESNKFVIDVVMSGEVKHTMQKAPEQSKYDFISAEDIEMGIDK